MGSQIGRRSLESAPAAFFLCQVVFVIASRSNGWRNVAVRVWSFHIEFEHTKLSNFPFSLESCYTENRTFLRVLVGEYHLAHNHGRPLGIRQFDQQVASVSVATRHKKTLNRDDRFWRPPAP